MVETWLIDPLNAPDFSLPDLAGKTWRLGSFRGSFLLLNFWTTTSPACVDQMRLLQLHQSALSSSGLRIVGIIIGSNADEPNDSRSLQSFLDKNLGRNKNTPSFPLLLGTQDVAGVYNIIYRYLFDRRRDLALPTSFLVDQDGMIVKVYQGPVDPERLAEDVKSAPRTAADRAVKALPLPGTLYLGEFQRNDFTYGVAFFQHGYLEQAEASFKQVIATKPDDPEAYYNLGTLVPSKKCAQRCAHISRADRKAAPKLSRSLEQSRHARRPARQRRRSDSQLPAIFAAAAGLCHRTSELGKSLPARGISGGGGETSEPRARTSTG